LKQTLVHLFRGSRCVRTWSKYWETDQDWTLCGTRHSLQEAALCTERPEEVSCSRCVELMHPGACRVAKTGCSFCEAGSLTDPPVIHAVNPSLRDFPEMPEADPFSASRPGTDR
jgi:hypothetical protein